MALQTDLSNLRLHHPAPHHAIEIEQPARSDMGKDPPTSRQVPSAKTERWPAPGHGEERGCRSPSPSPVLAGVAQVLALDHSEKSGGPPGSGPPARGRTSSNDHRHDRGKRPCL